MIRLFNVIDNIAYVITGRKQGSKQELDVTAGTHVVDITSPNVTFDKVKKVSYSSLFKTKKLETSWAQLYTMAVSFITLNKSSYKWFKRRRCRRKCVQGTLVTVFKITSIRFLVLHSMFRGN